MYFSDREPLYQAHNLSKKYGDRNIVSINKLVLERSGVYCVYGPNGSGKTTLFELLLLVKKPTNGKIVFKGQEIYPSSTGIGTLRLHATMVQQNPLLFDTTVCNNIDFGLKIRGIPKNERRHRIRRALELVGLQNCSEQNARKLSGGETQRVAIARACALDPEIVFLDEFTANIDAENRTIIENIILSINKERNTTIVFTTHYLDQAYRLTENVISMYKGRQVQSMPVNIFRGSISIENNATIFKNKSFTIYVSAPQNHNATIMIPPEAITLSESTIDSSMRNSLKGTVKHIIDEGKYIRLRIDAGDIFDTVITRESFNIGKYGPGANVWMNFKATAVIVL